jgi:type I restriction enzyme R subunit
VDNLIDHFRDKERRKTFFKFYKELEMLYEIISPDKFLRPFLDDFATLSGIYIVVRKAYARQVQPDREFLRKTNALVQKYIDTERIASITQFVEINPETLKLIQEKKGDYNTKVINLVKSIEKIAEDSSDDPYLVGMAERAKAVQESFEDRQKETAEALEELSNIIEANEHRKREQAAKNMDGLTYFVYSTLKEAGIKDPDDASAKIKTAFLEHPNWAISEKELREVRTQITFALYAQEDDENKVVQVVDQLITLLLKAQGK